MNEEITILLAKEGNENAFRQIYENNREAVYRLAYRYTRSQQDAEDILQETFIKAFKGINRFNYRNKSSFSAWLKQICVNCAIDYLRKRTRRKTDFQMPLTDLKVEPKSETNNPEETAQANQAVSIIQESIKKLSPKQRIIFDMRFTQHKNVKEIAEIMICSESNIKTQLARSVVKLRKQLAPILEEK